MRIRFKKNASKKATPGSGRPSSWKTRSRDRLRRLFSPGEKKPEGRKPWFSWKFKLAFFLIIAAILFFTSLLFHYFHGTYSYFRQGKYNQAFLSLAVKAVNQAIAGRVKAEGLVGDPLRELTLTKVEILDPDGAVLLQVGQAKLGWSLFDFRYGSPVVRLSAENGKVNAIKKDGVWNFRRLRKRKKPGVRRPARLPRLAAEIVVKDADLHLEYPPDRVLDAHVTLGQGVFRLSGNKVKYEIAELQAAVVEPHIGVNHLALQGTATSTEVGWDMRASSGELITASSEAHLIAGQYYTGLGKFAADFSYLEAAPDALAIFWPGHKMAVTSIGSGSLSGNFEEISFQAQLKSPAGSIRGTGKYDRKKRRLNLQGQMEDFSPGQFLGHDYSLSGLSGQYQMEYQAARKPGEPGGQGRSRERFYHFLLDLTAFRYPSLKSFPLRADVKLTGERFTAQVLSVNAGAHFELSAQGSLSVPYPLEVKSEVTELYLPTLREGMPEANLSGHLFLSGTGRSMNTFQGRGEVTHLNGKVKGYTIQNADLSGQISRGRINFDRATGTLQGIAVNGKGWIEPLRPNAPFNFDLELGITNPADLSAWTKNTVTAHSANFQLNLQGHKRKWTAEGSGSFGAVQLSSFRAPEARLSGKITVEDNRKFAGDLSLQAEEMNLPQNPDSKFRIPSMNVTLQTKIIPSLFTNLALDFELLARGNEPGYGLKSGGAFSADTKARRYRFDLASLELTIMKQEWRSESPAQIQFQAGEVRIQGLGLVNGRQKVSLDGPLQGRNLDLTLSVQNFELDPWAATLYPGDTLSGTLDTQLKIQGLSATPTVQGGLTVKDFQYRNFHLGEVNGGLKYSPEKLEFALLTSADIAKEVQARGKLPFRFALSPWALKVLPVAGMEIEIKAPEISAEVLNYFFPWLKELQGRISLEALITGSFENPIWNGKVQVKGIKFTIPEWGLHLRAIAGSATITHNLLTLQEMAVRSDHGRARLTGSITLKKFSVAEMNLVLDSEEFRAMNTPDIRADINAHLTLKGDLKFPRISGRLELADLLYRPPLLLTYQGLAWEKEDPTIEIKGKEKPAPKPSPFLDRADLFLTIVIPDSAKLRNSELNVRIGGELELKKPPAGFFLIFGKLATKEGWVTFQGKPFRVEKGEFMFPAIPMIDPDLNILASYRVPDYITYIKIGGTLSVPTLEIYSEPPLDPADVLAVILFGRPVSQLGEGERQSLAQTGGQLVTGYAASGLANSLTEALGVDALIFQAGDTPETSGIGIGKYLNERLYVFYYQHFGEERANEFKLRYELRKNLYIEAGQDAKGQGGADIFWSRPY